jgi:ArsR family transcriptional regulator
MNKIKEKSKFYKALGEPIRLKILEFLIKSEKCSCICELGKLLKRDQSVIFRHIQILKNAGIINTNKRSKYLMCCIKDKDKIKKILGY